MSVTTRATIDKEGQAFQQHHIWHRVLPAGLFMTWMGKAAQLNFHMLLHRVRELVDCVDLHTSMVDIDRLYVKIR